MTPRSVPALLRAHAARAPHELALHFLDGAGWESWTWSDYWAQARAAAQGLRRAGVEPGQHLLLLVPDPRQALPALLGCWTLGAVPVQVGFPARLSDPQAFVQGLERTAARMQARAIVLDARLLGQVAACRPALPLIDAGALVGPADETGLPDPDAPSGPALIQLTSGSTSSPRGAVIGWPALLDHLARISEALPLAGRPDLRGVSWLPLHHDMGLIGGLLFPLWNGFPLHLSSPQAFRERPYGWLEALGRLGAACTAAPPSAWAVALRLAGRARQDGLDLSRLACAMVGAEPIPPRLLRELVAAFAGCGLDPGAFFPVYGLAEATVAVTFPRLLAPPRVERLDRAALERERRALTATADDPHACELVGVGRPLPGTSVRIADAADAPLPARAVGEIQVRAASLMDGYFGDPAASAAARTADGWLRTGDLGFLAEGELFVCGRIKELIIKGGQNIAPASLEEVASTVEGVRAGCVVAVGLPCAATASERVLLVVESRLEPTEHPRLRAEIQAALARSALAADELRVLPPGALPRTSSGKLMRVEVRRLALAGLLTEAATVRA